MQTTFHSSFYTTVSSTKRLIVELHCGVIWNLLKYNWKNDSTIFMYTTKESIYSSHVSVHYLLKLSKGRKINLILFMILIFHKFTSFCLNFILTSKIFVLGKFSTNLTLRHKTVVTPNRGIFVCNLLKIWIATIWIELNQQI